MYDEKVNEAKDLNDIATFFEILASDQIACKRFHSTKKAKNECQIRADTYMDCANILKKTKLTG